MKAKADRKAGPDLKGLAAMPSLGKASAELLVDVGITTPTMLRRIGAEEAWRRLRFAHGKRVTVTWVYALDIAIRGIPWKELSEARAAKLKAAAEAIKAEIDRPAPGPPGSMILPPALRERGPISRRLTQGPSRTIEQSCANRGSPSFFPCRGCLAAPGRVRDPGLRPRVARPGVKLIPLRQSPDRTPPMTATDPSTSGKTDPAKDRQGKC